MKKPIPKELVISGNSLLWITASSEDARRWIEQEAPQFGQLFPPDPKEYTLFIGQEYDEKEVKAYLESYNSEVVEE